MFFYSMDLRNRDKVFLHVDQTMEIHKVFVFEVNHRHRLLGIGLQIRIQRRMDVMELRVSMRARLLKLLCD